MAAWHQAQSLPMPPLRPMAPISPELRLHFANPLAKQLKSSVWLRGISKRGMAMNDLIIPPKQAIIYQDDKLYVCLASFPLTRGHCIAAWKDRVKDINLLDRKDYEYLMNVVESARKALMKTLDVQKVYLLYLDETKHVHWQLAQRYKEKGYTVLNHQAEELENFDLAKKIKQNWSK
jgi:diadenosine tetraphosphate (Ap4A) HIT family hydrolase